MVSDSQPQLRPDAPTPRRASADARFEPKAPEKRRDGPPRQQLRSLTPAAAHRSQRPLLPKIREHPVTSGRAFKEGRGVGGVGGGSLPMVLGMGVSSGGARGRRATVPELRDLPAAHAKRNLSQRMDASYVRSAKELQVSHDDGDSDELLITKATYNLGVLTYRAAVVGEPMRSGVHRAEFTLVSGAAGVVVGVGRERLDPLTQNSILHTDHGWGLDVLNGDLVHGPGMDVQNTSWVGQNGGRRLDQDAGIYRRAVEGDRIGLELDLEQGSLAVYRNDIFLGVLVRSGLRVLNGGAREIGGGMVWVVELARKGQAVRVKLTSSSDEEEQLVGMAGKTQAAALSGGAQERGQMSRLTVRRASAPAAFEPAQLQATPQQQKAVAANDSILATKPPPTREYALRSQPLKPILKKRPPPPHPPQQHPVPPWTPPERRMVRNADLEVAKVTQPGRRRRDDYVGEIGVKAEALLRAIQ